MDGLRRSPLKKRNNPILSLDEIRVLGESVFDIHPMRSPWFIARLIIICLCAVGVGIILYLYKDILQADYIVNQPLSQLSFARYIGLRIFFAVTLAAIYCYSYLRQAHVKLVFFGVFIVALSALLSDLSSIYAYVYHGALFAIHMIMLLRFIMVMCLFFNYWNIRHY